MDRKEVIITAGAKLAAKHGAANVTRRMVAAAAKLPESVVSYYMGTSAAAQNAYGRRAKKLGLTLPDKATTAALGVKLRAHGPRAASKARKVSAREVKAIKEKVAPQTVKAQAKAGNAARPGIAAKLSGPTNSDTTGSAKRAARKPKVKPAPSETKALPGPSENKSAARAPMAPPPSTLPLANTL